MSPNCVDAAVLTQVINENTIKTNTKATEAQTFAINELRDEIKRN